MTKYIFFLISCSLFLHNCDDDSFSQVIKIDIPVHDPKPALNLQIAAGDDSLLALVSNSKGVTDPTSDYNTPIDAEVNLYKNGLLMTELEYDEMSLKYAGLLSAPISYTAGDEYVLEAKLPGFDLVTATQIMPAKPIITNATYEVEGTIDSEGTRVDEVIVDLSDADLDQLNYLGIRLFQIGYNINGNGDTINTYRNDLYLETNDPLISYSNRYSLIFTDEAFSNGEFQVRAYTYSFFQQEGDIEVEVYHLTKDAFLFERSLEQYYNAVDNPFAEPVTVHNNIEGGYGIFSLVNSTIFKIM